MSKLKDLIDDVTRLEEIASKIQDGEHVGLSKSKIDELIEMYHSLYAECLSALPDDLKEKFRFEYEGNWISFRIKRFLEESDDINQLHAYAEKDKPNPFSYWKYPYKTTFSAPIRAQKQLLIEAYKRQPQPYPSYESIALIERLARNFHVEAVRKVMPHVSACI